jgi:hypothetical protein
MLEAGLERDLSYSHQSYCVLLDDQNPIASAIEPRRKMNWPIGAKSNVDGCDEEFAIGIWTAVFTRTSVSAAPFTVVTVA